MICEIEFVKRLKMQRLIFTIIYLFVFLFSGSLMTRNLNDIVKKENFVIGSEYLSTLLVVVPKYVSRLLSCIT